MSKKLAASKEHPVNLKEQNSLYSFGITIRNREHFYKIVNWLNKNIGKGNDNWAMKGRVLSRLKQGETAQTVVYIFKEGFNDETSMYLTLI